MEISEIPRLSGELHAGDRYVAQRNGPARLLTVRTMRDGYVIPVENAYPYDIHECVKISDETYLQFRDKAEEDYAAWREPKGNLK